MKHFTSFIACFSMLTTPFHEQENLTSFLCAQEKRMFNIKNVRYACWIFRRHIKPRQLFQKKSTLHKQQNMNRWKEKFSFFPSYFIYCFSGAVYVQEGVVFFIVWRSIVFLLILFIPLCSVYIFFRENHHCVM